jgi:NAD(P)-dependent dehydrogenase (short-subunit alcohol dehydrogenase family)
LWSPARAADMLQQFLRAPAAGKAAWELPSPMGRYATPEQVAGLFEFLLSDKARFIVGQVIAIDGGIEANLRPNDWPRAWQVEPKESHE